MQDLTGSTAAQRRRDVAYHRFAQVLHEVAARFQHSALSLAVTERADFACAFCDAEGESVIEWAGSALVAGTLGPQLRAALAAYPALLAPAEGHEGDVVALCDPFTAGVDPTYLTLCLAITDEERELVGFLLLCAARGEAARRPGGRDGRDGQAEPPVDLDVMMLPTVEAARQSELAALPPAVGPRYQVFQDSGSTPMVPLTVRTAEEEGQPLVPTLLTDLLERQLASLGRDPIERLCDLRAQRAALHHGQQRLRALVKRLGKKAVRDELHAQKEAAEQAMTAALARISDGVYAFADSLDDDGTGTTDLPVRVTLRKAEGRLGVDLTDSAPGSDGALNLTAAVTRSVVRHALRVLLPEGAPVCDASLRRVRIQTEPDSLLDARGARALAAGHETALRLYDVLLGALAQALPRDLPAASGGTLSALVLRTPRLFHREPLAAGRGASARAPGRDTRAPLPLTGGQPVSVEILEQRLPVRVLRWAVREGSGGGGVHPGSDGVVRELLLLSDLHVELVADRRRRAPFGLAGGGPGQLGRDVLTHDGVELALPAKLRILLRAGDVLRTESPGGGGHGDPTRAQFFAQLLAV